MKGLEQFAQMSCNIGLDDTTLRTIFAALDDDGSGTLGGLAIFIQYNFL